MSSWHREGRPRWVGAGLAPLFELLPLEGRVLLSTTTLTPTADAFVRGGGYANTNFGAKAALEVKSTANAPGHTRESLLKFNLTGLSTVVAAHLRLWGSENGASPPVRVAAQGASGNWSESAITWNNEPALDPTVLDTEIVRGKTGRWYDWDVTSYIRQQQQAGAAEGTLALRGTTAPTDLFASLRGKESAAAAGTRPRLVVTTLRAPARLAATSASPSKVNLVWHDNSDNETGFTIQRATDENFTQGLTTIRLPANTTVYHDTSVAGDTAYFYRARATTSAVSSDYSANAVASTSAPGVTVFYDPSDPNGANAAYYNAHPEVANNIRAAWADWASHLKAHVDPATGQPANITLQVRFDPNIPTANGGSNGTPHVVGTQGGFPVYEEAVAYKIETGVDSNGSAPDAQITIGDQPGTASYLRNVLWFDPSPATRGSTSAAPVPAGKTDAYGRFLHEIGHILGINGKRDGTTGNIFDPNGWRSTFDALTTVSNGKFFFTGPAAKEAYLGKDVPLTPGQTPVSHLGNASGPGNSSDSLLDQDPMSGFATYAGFRNFLSPVDINILRDIGLTVVDPEPYVSISAGTTYTLTAPATQPNTPPTLRLTSGQMSVGTNDLNTLYPGITVIRSNGAVLTTGLQTRPLPTGVTASTGAQFSYVDGELTLTGGTLTFVDGLQLYWLNVVAQGSGSQLIFNGSDNIKSVTLGGGASVVVQ